MAQIDNPKEAFAFLRPSCVILTREPTVANVEVLNNCLHTVSDGALQQLQDYVLFPLRFVLKIPGPKQEGLVLAVMDTMHYVLEKTSVRNWESLYSIFSELCMCISCPNDPGMASSASEELKLSVLKCLDVLLHAAYGDVVFRLYEPSMLPTLGAAISLILSLIGGERAREVQIAALNCLQAFIFQCDCLQDHVIPNVEERYALGNALASFLPGVTQTLSQVICHNVARGHVVVMRALRVLYKMLSVVMDDEQLLNKETVKVLIHNETFNGLAIDRSANWTKNTSQRLSVALQKIISCTSAHQHWRVRLELVSLSECLLTKCSKSLEECSGSLIGALVGAVNDDDASVREKSSTVLKDLSSQATKCQAFTDILSENLHVLSSSLPQLMRTSDDHRKFFVLSMFLGYMKVLGPQVEVVLNSAVHLKRISKAMMHVLEMDMTDVRMVEERSLPILIPDGSNAQRQSHVLKTHFLYFTDDRIYLVLREICQMLGHYGNLHLLVDHFMDLYRESSAYRKQSIWVLNEVLAGAAGLDVEDDQSPRPASHLDLKSVISLVIEEYISADNWHLPTSYEQSIHSDQENHAQSHLLAISKNPNEVSMATVGDVKHLNSNIWQICLQLEGIGIFSRVLGLNFRPLLMMVLYSVLEKVGDKSSLVSQSAVCTMFDICQACGYVSPSELINSNADYLLNDISLNLGRPSSQPHAPRVFAAMVTHSDDTLLPLVVDVVQDVLTSLDLNHDQRASEVCEVLHSVLKAIVALGFSSKKQPNSLETKSEDFLDARKFLLDYSILVKQAEGIITSQEDEDDQGISSVTEEDHAESIDPDGVGMDTALPPHITIAKDVMERCIHLMSMSSPRLRLKVLHMLKLCVNVMCEFKDHLFPMVHCCWPVLQQRLNDEDPFIIPQAFKLLCTMGEVCTDFLKKRASKTVIPKIAAYLSKQAQTTAKAGPNYTQSVNYKLQLAYLQGLGPLCVSLDLDESDVEMVSEACLPYLSVQQPPKLQESCCSVFQCLINKDPDVIWFMLCEQFCPYAYQPLHGDLMPVKLCGMGRQDNEYTHNIVKLLTDYSKH